MKSVLADECDYAREATFVRTFGSKEFLGDDPRFKVPWVWEGSTDRVLVMERVGGVSVGDALVSGLSQSDRNEVCLVFLLLAHSHDGGRSRPGSSSCV
jgi:aarF domain-containing kinase